MLFGEKDGAVTEFFSLSDGVRLDGALLSSLTKEELAQRSMPLVEFFYDDVVTRRIRRDSFFYAGERQQDV